LITKEKYYLVLTRENALSWFWRFSLVLVLFT
jgi:hypothetical protein